MTKQNNLEKAAVMVSVVLPAYNEVNQLEAAVAKISQALEQLNCRYEVIIAEDGSTDGTAEKAEELAQRYSYVKHIHCDRRLGRGAALKNAFKRSSGQVLVYMDLDLATDLKALKSLVEAITVEGYMFSTGSRMLPDSKVERGFGRSASSKTFNFLVKRLLGSKVRDHQCGFKAFRREPMLSLIDEVEATHWFWDTEILVRAGCHGYSIKEIPVEWKSGKETKVSFFKDSSDMLKQTMKLRRKLKRQGLI